ncbi:RNA-directed DNA polymerase [Gossypium australe]|uniref:RNA-directed DNA polymerase n=1 Tax=Gossypium australe TaxID=47621 RepID=A0A5B6UY23_9ROSI|nr:RNA-directed DNA polymerase [Gossypium australe]
MRSYHFPFTNLHRGNAFSLVYGMEEIFPIRRFFPLKLRFLLFEEDVESYPSWLDIPKTKMQTYDKKVHPREFHEGDLMPNWEGPYVVKKVFSGGVLILTEMDVTNLPNHVNSDSIKKYFT